MKMLSVALLLLTCATAFAEEEIRLSVTPFDNRNFAGGMCQFVPRLVTNGPDGAEPAGIKLQYARFTMGGKKLYETNAAPFYFKSDLTLWSNGNYPFTVEAKDVNGASYTFSSNFIVSNVKVKFRLKVKTPVPDDKEVWLTGSTPVLKPVGEEWNPLGAKMDAVGADTYETTILAGMNEVVTYEFDLGGWSAKGRLPSGDVLHKAAKVTNAGQLIEATVEHWGRMSNKIAPNGWVASFDGMMTNLVIAVSRPKAEQVDLAWGYDGVNFSTLSSAVTQFAHFSVPAKQGQTLYFTISNGGPTNQLSVPKPAVPFDLLWLSDVHMQSGGPVAWIPGHEKADFMLYGGDVVNSGFMASDWNTVHGLMKKIWGKWLIQAIAGNHEEESYAHPLVTGRPWNFSFRWGNAAFIAFDNSLAVMPGMEEYTWIENELKKAKDADFRVVYFHIPPYSDLRHGDNIEAQKYLIPLFDKYHVQLVLCGHEHSYQRTDALKAGKPDPNGTVYVVAGSGVGRLYDRIKTAGKIVKYEKLSPYLRLHVDTNAITVTAVDGANGKVIDTVTVGK